MKCNLMRCSGRGFRWIWILTWKANISRLVISPALVPRPTTSPIKKNHSQNPCPPATTMTTQKNPPTQNRKKEEKIHPPARKKHMHPKRVLSDYLCLSGRESKSNFEQCFKILGVSCNAGLI